MAQYIQFAGRSDPSLTGVFLADHSFFGWLRTHTLYPHSKWCWREYQTGVRLYGFYNQNSGFYGLIRSAPGSVISILEQEMQRARRIGQFLRKLVCVMASVSMVFNATNMVHLTSPGHVVWSFVLFLLNANLVLRSIKN